MERIIKILMLSVTLIIIANLNAFADSGSKVEALIIEKHVSKSFDKELELVSFAPGSGWLKLRTRDEISPILLFKSVSQDDIRRFNRFSKSIMSPFRVKLAGGVLYLQHIRNDTDKADTRIDIVATKERRLFQFNAQPHIILHRNKAGKIYLVKEKDKPEKIKHRAITDMAEK